MSLIRTISYFFGQCHTLFGQCNDFSYILTYLGQCGVIPIIDHWLWTILYLFIHIPKHDGKKGNQIRARPSPPLFGQGPKEIDFFPGRCSLNQKNKKATICLICICLIFRPSFWLSWQTFKIEAKEWSCEDILSSKLGNLFVNAVFTNKRLKGQTHT